MDQEAYAKLISQVSIYRQNGRSDGSLIKNGKDYTFFFAREGKTASFGFSVGSGWKKPPTENDVLHSLIVDMQIKRDSEDFESWAADMGYTEFNEYPEALNTWNLIAENTKKLRSIFYHQELAQLEEFFQDY